MGEKNLILKMFLKILIGSDAKILCSTFLALINKFNRICLIYYLKAWYFLDIDHGTYPFVTSSNTTASQAGIGVV